MRNNARPEDFKQISVIGKGSYGKVVLASHQEDANQIYAMKILKKKYIEKKNQESNVIIERDILASVNHQFIVKLFSSFQDEKKLYFILEYCPGGEFFSLLSKMGRLSEQHAQFYTAQIIEALDYLHERNILYRDLKPENVLVDSQGYLKLTDFGLSKLNVQDSNAMTMSGTPEYLAPEIINRIGHGKPVDWWCLGSMLYEMVIGLPPFYCENRSQLFEKIRFSNPKFPDSLSPELKDFLELLLEKEPEKRLGTVGGGKSLKNHAWFTNFDWKAIELRKIDPPYIPSIKSVKDVSNFDPEFTCSSVHSLPSLSSSCSKPFFKFSFNKSAEEENTEEEMDIEMDEFDIETDLDDSFSMFD